MPAIQGSSISGPGTFPTLATPPLNQACAVASAVKVGVGLNDRGFITLLVTDLNQIPSLTSGWSTAITVLIEDADRIAGFKNISIAAGTVFSNAASLQCSVLSSPNDGANQLTAPPLATATLNSFTANIASVQVGKGVI